jgi:DNA-binding MarR family transcriptional regulator
MINNLYKLLPFGSSLAILTKSYYGALTKRLEHLEIDRHFSILILIENMGDSCTQHYICEQLKIDKVSMVRMIQYLIEKKFIVKVINEQDKREHFLQLTKKSKTMLPQIHQAIGDLNEMAFESISLNKQHELFNMLAQIQTNLNELPTDRIYINYKKSTKK